MALAAYNTLKLSRVIFNDRSPNDIVFNFSQQCTFFTINNL